MTAHRPTIYRRLIILTTNLGLALLCLGGLFSAWQFQHARRLGQAVELTNRIEDHILLVERTANEALIDHRYAALLHAEALLEITLDLDRLEQLAVIRRADLRWLDIQSQAITTLSHHLNEPMPLERRRFLIGRLGEQLVHLGASSSILNRTAFAQRSDAVQALFWSGMVLFAIALSFLGALRQLYRKHQQLEQQNLEEATQHRAEMDAANCRLQAYALELEQYLRIVHHDLKEPIRSVALYSEMLQQQAGALDPTAEGFLIQLRKGALRMQRLLDDLIQLAALGQTPPQPVEVDAQAEAEEIVAMLTPQLEAAGGSVVLKTLPRIVVDRWRFALLLQNLLSNAIKYRDPDRQLQIVVEAESEPQLWCFRVRDNGCGIPLEHRERVFELFTRLHGREIEGSGAGLALCRKTVEQWGGMLWVEDGEGPGTTMVFTVPRSTPAEPQPEAVASSSRTPPLRPGTRLDQTRSLPSGL